MEVILVQEKNSLKSISTSSLLQQLKEKEPSGFSKNDLRAAFHFRFVNILFQHCRRLCLRNRIEETVAKDLVQDTMLKAFEKINKFSCDNCVSEEQIKNTISAWLNRIAFNLFIDFLRDSQKTFVLDGGEDEIASDYILPSDFEFGNTQELTLIIQKAWDELDDREKLIVYLCIKYDCLDNKHHLPDNAISLICERFGVEKGYIRLIKLRALKKIRITP